MKVDSIMYETKTRYATGTNLTIPEDEIMDIDGEPNPMDTPKSSVITKGDLGDSVKIESRQSDNHVLITTGNSAHNEHRKDAFLGNEDSVNNEFSPPVRKITPGIIYKKGTWEEFTGGAGSEDFLSEGNRPNSMKHIKKVETKSQYQN